MALPSDFNAFEHLQDIWRKVHNKRVREHFRDLADPDGDWDAEIDTPRGSLRVACTMNDDDTGDMTTIRTLLFWVVLGEAAALQPPIYGIPVDRFQQTVKFAPQVTLYFKEDWSDVEEGYAPIDAEVSFRMMGESTQSLSQAELNNLAAKIRNEFATGQGYRWQKGRVVLSYRDLDRGYRFIIHAYSETEGRDVISKILSLQGHSIDLKFLTINQLAETPPIVPPSQTILGRARRLPRKRPVGFVRFLYADINIWGLPNAVCLVDRSGRRRSALISA
jgi:hypothetical protein